VIDLITTQPETVLIGDTWKIINPEKHFDTEIDKWIFDSLMYLTSNFHRNWCLQVLFFEPIK
jgi:hypothetical protein